MGNEKEFESDNRFEEERGEDFVEDREYTEVRGSVEELEEDGKIKVEKIKAEGIPEDVEEMEGVLNQTTEEVSEAENTYNAEKQEEINEEERLDLAEKYVEANYDKIEKTTKGICERLGIKIDGKEIEEEVIKRLTAALKDEGLLKTLEEEGVIDEDTASSIIFLIPRIEKAIEATREGEGYEEKAKEIIKVILDNPEQDPKYIRAAGELLVGLSISGKIPDKRMALVVRVFGLALQNGTVQHILSKQFRAWLEEEKKGEKSEEEVVKEISDARED